MKEPGFTKVGEVTDDKQRAKRVDEALDILAGLWSGKPFTYKGQYYQIKEVTFLPKPLQTPRIPIWIRGNWPRKGPVRRAMRWDGFLPADPMEPEDVRELRALVQSERVASDSSTSQLAAVNVVSIGTRNVRRSDLLPRPERLGG